MPDSSHSPDLPREVETALVIRSESPERVARSVVALDGVADVAFAPAPRQSIVDRYVDTPAGELGSRRLALRVREVDGAPRITLKGDAVSLASGTDRLELELPWSREALQRVLAELDRLGIRVDAQAATGGEPLTALGAAGLGVVQERETLREVREVVDATTGGRRAELDVDAVTYRLEHGAARLYEVEIEARSETTDLGGIASSLRRDIPALEPWPYSKLATGKAIDEGLATGWLRLGPNGLVTPAALDWLAAALADER